MIAKPAGRYSTAANDEAVKVAESEIQRVLLELEEKSGLAVDRVEVDTRNWAQLRTEITLTTTKRY